MLKAWMLMAALVLLTAGCASESVKESIKSGDGCHTPLGFIPEGQTATGYLHQIESAGQTCQQGTLRCEDGVWTGAYIYPSCVVNSQR